MTAHQGDREISVTDEFGVWTDQFHDIPLNKPADDVLPDGKTVTYWPGDGTVGDLDGDGEYELVFLWNPSISKDNSQSGYTGKVYAEAVKFDGTSLWRIDLGVNIRAGAHYTQLEVFDFDGDGRSEVAFKTADGTVDGVGTVIGNPSADYRNSSGYILSGPEYLTVFDGQTGAAIDTVDYKPGRGNVGSWGDTYGNRVDRFLAGVAYLDGEHPSLVMSRGYYTRTVIVAWDLVDGELVERWTFDSNVAGSTYEGQGNHQFVPADVDRDGLDEIVFGSMTIDDDGTPLYNTRLHHGDALHVSDFVTDRPGLEVYAVHESPTGNGGIIASMRDAETGAVIWSNPGNRDTGRGAASDIDPTHPGAEAWNIGGDYAWNSPVGTLNAASGEVLSTDIPAANFVTWWDGDLTREITDHDYSEANASGVPTISKWDPAAQGGGRAAAPRRHAHEQHHQGQPGAPGRPVRRLARGARGAVGRRQRHPGLHDDGCHGCPHPDPDARLAVPRGRRRAELGVQPAAAPVVLHRRGHGGAAGAVDRVRGCARARRDGAGHRRPAVGHGGGGCPAAAGRDGRRCRERHPFAVGDGRRRRGRRRMPRWTSPRSGSRVTWRSS